MHPIRIAAVVLAVLCVISSEVHATGGIVLTGSMNLGTLDTAGRYSPNVRNPAR